MINDLKKFITKIKNGECSTIELTLTGICLLLFGILLGMRFSPFRICTFGSFNANGCNNQGSITKPE
ncbi:MAG: hypothetical protein E7280_08490 [Lachnospiraceae bacterium]|nr:hypothetical protein [Lachnospiraceae bacterium]